MTDSPNIHWTTDAELLAQFVMGHLDSARAAQLEAHLRDCTRCQDAVRAEQEIAAGIRRAGRDAMKQRLAQRVAEKGMAVSWYRVAGVAAAIVILVSLGIYNKWFFQSEMKLADAGLRSDSIAPKLESPPAQPRVDKNLPDKREADVAKPMAGKDAKVGAGVAQLDKADNEPANAYRFAAATATPASEIWVEGEVIASQPVLHEAAEAGGKQPEKARDNVLEKKKEPAALMSQTSRTRVVEVAELPVTVQQQALSALPPRQRNQLQRASTVQTLMRTDSSGLAITLFTDSTLSSQDLRQARVQSIRGDSLILLLGSQRIGYRLPPGWTGQSAKQLQKAK